ncbi:MAG: lysophospholipid acyltransferase family protein [Candidatus Dormibacteria bacterium]
MAKLGVAEPNRGLKLGLNLVAALLHRVGPSRYRISDPLSNAAFALSRRRRLATIRNYRMVFPEMGHREARRLAARSFREYGRTSLDFVYVHRLARPRLISLFRSVGVDDVRRMRAAGLGGIFVLMHLGAWDAGAAWATAVGVPLTAVMADEGSNAVQDLVIWARAEMGLTAVTASHAPRVVLATLRRGGWVALLADIPGDTKSVEVDFLGQRARFSVAPVMLAARTGCPLFAVVSVRTPAGGYLVEVHPPHAVSRDADPATAMGPLLQVFEQAVRRWPEQWFPFEEDRLFAPAGR